MKMFKFILVFIFTFFSVNLFSQCTGALSSSLNPSSITPGQSTTLSYNLTNNGSPCISALNIDIYYSTSAFNAPSGSNVSCGSASSSAGKICSGNDLGGGHFRVIIYGGTSTIGNGSIVNIQFTSKSNAPEGTYSFTCTGEASNPNGAPVTITSCISSNVVICILPSCASNPNPSNGATGVSISTSLSWSSVPGATSYDVYFGTSSNPPFKVNTTSTSYNPGTLNEDTIYYWKIVPKNSCGSASGCPVWNFTTLCTPPSCASNPNPSNGATGTSTSPTLSWSSVSGATSYDVYFGTSSSPPLVTNVSNTQYSPGNLNSNTTYYWKIVPKNSCGSASGCSVWSFTTGTAPLSCTASASPTSGNAPLTVSFTSTSSGGTYPYTYLWNFGDGQTSNQQNTSHIYQNPGTYNWNFTVTDNTGNQCIKNGTVFVSAPPNFNCTASAEPASGEAPLEVHFFSSVTGGTAPYTYSWQFGDGEGSNQQNPVHTYTIEGTYNWQFISTDSANSSCTKSGTILVSEKPSGYSDFFIIPAGAHSPGAYDSYWKTDLTICNFSSSNQDLNLALLKAGQDNTNSQNIDFSIIRDSCKGFHDFLYEEFNFEGAGALKISAYTDKIKIKSRTYNDDPSGTFGQFIPGFHQNNLLSSGETGYLTFLHKNENFRTNIGFASMSKNFIDIIVEFYSSEGQKIGEKYINLKPFEYLQLNDIFSQIGVQNISFAYAKISSISSGALYIGYASVVDNGSNDPIFIPVEK